MIKQYLPLPKTDDIEKSILDGISSNTVLSVLYDYKEATGRHAYAIKKSDEKYIYLINPHNSSETLQVERALLQTKNSRIYYALIDMN